MIPDHQTNFVYFSKLLKEWHPYFFKELTRILDKHNIKYGLLELTKDIWCRDYMPIQLSKNDFFQFAFNPGYLDDKDYLRTNPIPVTKTLDWISDIPKTNSITVDGGNIVKERNKIIMTRKVFEENQHCTTDDLTIRLKEYLKIDEIIFIPSLPGDFTGHADGMVRFVDEDTVIINDYHEGIEDKDFFAAFHKSLRHANLNIITMPYALYDNPNSQYDYDDATGCYLNYLQVGDLIIFSTFGYQADEEVVKVAKKVFKDCKLETIRTNELARLGGLLNCIAWNVLK